METQDMSFLPFPTHVEFLPIISEINEKMDDLRPYLHTVSTEKRHELAKRIKHIHSSLSFFDLIHSDIKKKDAKKLINNMLLQLNNCLQEVTDDFDDEIMYKIQSYAELSTK